MRLDRPNRDICTDIRQNEARGYSAGPQTQEQRDRTPALEAWDIYLATKPGTKDAWAALTKRVENCQVEAARHRRTRVVRNAAEADMARLMIRAGHTVKATAKELSVDHTAIRPACCEPFDGTDVPALTRDEYETRMTANRRMVHAAVGQKEAVA